MEYFLDSFLLASVAGIWFDWCSVLFLYQILPFKGLVLAPRQLLYTSKLGLPKITNSFSNWAHVLKRTSKSYKWISWFSRFPTPQSSQFIFGGCHFPLRVVYIREESCFFPPNLVVLLYKSLVYIHGSIHGGCRSWHLLRIWPNQSKEISPRSEDRISSAMSCICKIVRLPEYFFGVHAFQTVRCFSYFISLNSQSRQAVLNCFCEGRPFYHKRLGIVI